MSDSDNPGLPAVIKALLGTGTPQGCPAVHLLEQERAGYRASIKDPINAIGRLHRLLSVMKVSSGRDRMLGICLWAMTGDGDYITDVSDRVALLGGLAGGSPVPVAPSFQGTPPS